MKGQRGQRPEIMYKKGDMEMGKQTAWEEIDKKSSEIFTASDEIWGCAETAFTEDKSMKILCDVLKAEGFTVETGLADVKTAFKGTFGSGKPVIGILGEFDALSGLDQEAGATEKIVVHDGASGHGCGHNMLGTASLSAAIGIKKYLEESGKPGTVIYFGCPGEEGGSGKSFMARDGVFDNLDFAVTWHPGDKNVVSVGSSLANYQIIYRFYGQASHAAACPELGRSALDAVELMNTGVQYLREHIIQEARIHYAITNTGGYSPNVVQPYSEVLYLIRAPKNSQVKEIYERVNDIARGAALMTGTKMELQFVKACSNLVDNTVMEEIMQKNLEEIEREPYTAEEIEFARKIGETFGGNHVDIQDVLVRYEKSRKAAVEQFLAPHADDVINDFIVPLMDTEECLKGSTDVGDVSWVCPTAQINAVTEAAGTPGHSWQMVSQGKSSIAHKGMQFAGKVMAGTVIDMLEKPELIEEAKKELRRRVGAEGYIPPIPEGIRPMAINPKK